MNRLFTFLTTAFALSFAGLHSQTVMTDLSFDGLFDNREYKEDMLPQTIYGMRLTPVIGLQKDGHTLAGGISAIWEFGADGHIPVTPVLFYNYSNEVWSTYFGFIPRNRLQRQLPDCMLYDSIAFFQPAIEGTLIQYTGGIFQTELYCNWFSRQTETRREAFRIVSDGFVGMEGAIVSAGWYAAMTHYAKPKERGHFIYEQFQANPYLLFDLTDILPGQHLEMNVNAGLLVGLQRCRADENWECPVGLLAGLDMRLKRLGFDATVYSGKSQQRFLQDSEAGLSFHRSDPFYNHGLYCRAGMEYRFIESGNADLSFRWDLNFTDGAPVHNRQLIKVSYRFDACHELNHRKTDRP